MKHTELKVGDRVLQRSRYISLWISTISNVTPKTVETKATLKSSYYDRITKYTGDILFVYDEKKYSKVMEIKNQITSLQAQEQKVINSMDRIEIQ